MKIGSSVKNSSILFWLLIPPLISACAPDISDDQYNLMAFRIVESMKSNYSDNPDLVSVTLPDFDLLDHTYYQEMTEQLVKRGFNLVGDFENKTISQANPSVKTCIRALVDREGHVEACIYQIRKSHDLPEGMKILEFETAFSDGYFVNTNNIPNVKHVSRPPEFKSETLLTDSIDELLARQHERSAKYSADHPGVSPIEIRTLDQVMAVQKDLVQKQARHRREIQGISEEELRAAGPNLSNKQIAILLERIHKTYLEQYR